MNLPVDTPVASLLLDAAWKSLLLLAASSGITLSLRRASAATRHLVWFLSLASLILVPLLAIALPAWRVLPNLAQRAHQVSAAMNSERGVTYSQTTTKHHQAKDATPPIGNPISPIASFKPPEATLLLESGDFLVLVWLAGASIALIPFSFGLLSLWHLGHNCLRLNSTNWLELLQESLARLSFERPITLLTSTRRAMPMTWGFLHSKLLLPSAAESWTAERRRMVLLHELAHIKRWDYLTNLLSELVCSIYWFNPLVWHAASRLRVEREQACDDLVLRSGCRAADYAGGLLELVADLRGTGRLNYLAAPMARPSALERRVRAIMDKRRNRTGITSIALAGWLASVLAFVTPVAMLRAQDDQTSTVRQVLAERDGNLEMADPTPDVSQPLIGHLKDLKWFTILTESAVTGDDQSSTKVKPDRSRNQNDSCTLEVISDGTYLLQGKLIPSADITAQLANDLRANRNLIVYVKMDKKVKTEDFARALKAIEEAGIQRISFRWDSKTDNDYSSTTTEPDQSPNQDHIRTLDVFSDGTYRLQGKLIPCADITAQLAADFRKNPSLVVYVNTDKKAKTDNFANALKAIEDAGISRISFRWNTNQP